MWRRSKAPMWEVHWLPIGVLAAVGCKADARGAVAYAELFFDVDLSGCRFACTWSFDEASLAVVREAAA